MADVEPGALKQEELVGAAESNVHAALCREDVDQAVVAPGAGTALGRRALAADVQAGDIFVLQRTEVAQQGVLAQSGKDQGGRGQQEPA